jgi:uncharacterized protein
MYRLWLSLVGLVVALGCTLAAADAPKGHGALLDQHGVPAVVAEGSHLVQGRSEPSREARIVARARTEVEREVSYDPTYVRLSFRDGTDTGRVVYPGGDLNPGHGVCTDVAVRALRAVGIDLQERVHADILARPSAYPAIAAPDTNIDHRRVGPLLTYLRAHELSPGPNDWKAGDLVVWAFGSCPHCTPDHIGVVSDRIGPRGLPLVIHNIGPKPTEDDVLDAWTTLGHFRIRE